MDLKKLFNSNKAVSPVIGVVLMVAITVILAAAIGSSVFGQGPAKSAPQANIDIEAVSPTTSGSDDTSADARVRIEHLGGDPIHFADNPLKTKVLVSVEGRDSIEVDAADLATMEVGDVKMLTLTPSTTDTEFTIGAGDSVNIKIIDVQTKQLICDKTLRF
ncbi:type IV pilin [Methanosarcina sp.]|uniref:type IV pilin n=1 Tax=Methanosarcina sp. TaxID=2213 RepID=UPI002ABC3B1A|nr:type IV pilin [Methanosarcina sp.]MDY9926568.1 type IV pilin [Methanosarcina sp.]